jgi:hypothetical protein
MAKTMNPHAKARIDAILSRRAEAKKQEKK